MRGFNRSILLSQNEFTDLDGRKDRLVKYQCFVQTQGCPKPEYANGIKW